MDRRIVAHQGSNRRMPGPSAKLWNNICVPKRAGSFAWLEDLVESSSFSAPGAAADRAGEQHNQPRFADGEESVTERSGRRFMVYAVTSMVFWSRLPWVLAWPPYRSCCCALRRNRRLATFNKALPDAIDMMSRSLRAGHSMAAAIGIVAEQAVAPVKPGVRRSVQEAKLRVADAGRPATVAGSGPSQDLRVLVTGIMVQKDTGGNLVDILDRIVFVIRERLRIQGEIRTHTAQGRHDGMDFVCCCRR